MTSEHSRIHFVGIGGIGMSGLARLYLHDGATVSGSDKEDKQLLADLEKEGVTIYRSHGAANVPADADLVVYSDGVPVDNVERAKASELGIRQMQYFEALGEAVNDYCLVAVSGTHGKTTTTAMLIDIFEEAGLDPTAVVGSLRGKTGSNFRAGKSKYCIVEADEYRRHFLFLNPDMVVITNLEFDHADYFDDLADVQHAFAELIAKLPDEGIVVAPTADPAIVPVLADTAAAVVDYKTAFDPERSLPQPGLHNQLNAAAAAATARELGIADEVIARALDNFAGTKRRFEYKGLVNNAPVFDDYAHHPAEVAATITAAKEKYRDRALTVLFQPHTFSRTKEFRSQFVTALAKADRIVLVPIYASRETDDGSISSQDLVDDLMAAGATVQYFHTLPAAAQSIASNVSEDDVVVVMGAGDITKAADQLVGK